MRFVETQLDGAWIIELELRRDSRGFFARSFCRKEFAAHGLSCEIAQSNLAATRQRGTVRGLHYQLPPAAEVKLVQCVRGAIYDVIVDVRPQSKTYLQHLGVHLSAENRRSLLVPAGCAHGYQALEDDVEMTYLVSEFYAPEHERGLRYDDPDLRIAWPQSVTSVSDKDRQWPLVGELSHRAAALQQTVLDLKAVSV